jgi:hypothetical protein
MTIDIPDDQVPALMRFLLSSITARLAEQQPAKPFYPADEVERRWKFPKSGDSVRCVHSEDLSHRLVIGTIYTISKVGVSEALGNTWYGVNLREIERPSMFPLYWFAQPLDPWSPTHSP